MKNLFLVFVLCLIAKSNAQDSEYISLYPSYEKGQVVYLFGDQVNLRETPDMVSTSLGIMPIGSRLIIQQPYDSYDSSGGAFWVKVNYKDMIGYVRSDFISLQTFHVDGIPHYTQLIDNQDDPYLLIRVPTQRTPAYDELKFEVASTMFHIEVLGNKGLHNIRNMVHLDYIAEACGVNGGGKYLFIDDSNIWHDAFSYVQVADSGIFYWVEELKFPDEHKKGDFILYSSEYASMEDEGDDFENPEHTEKHNTERVLRWNGTQITPKFKQEPVPTNEW